MYQFDRNLFNPQQLEAVLHNEGPILVLAGAGSGKTRIIAHRIAYLIDYRNVDPASIVAVSFTNKAARELRQRVAQLIGDAKAKRSHLSTFHALGANILRTHIPRLGWKLPFAIIDTDDQLSIIRNVLKDLHLQGSTYDPQMLLGFISKVKTAHVAPLDLPGMRWKPQGRTLAKIFDHYQIVRKSMNAVDFDDMIALPTEIFETCEDVRQQYAKSWQYLLVDEYQDTNALQFRMLQLLCRERANLMVVGDDDQSIYAFRGADSSHILEFPKLFENVKVVSLEQNYRSTQVILDAANAVIARNTVRHPKKLWSQVREGEKIQSISCTTPEEEAGFVIEQIAQLKGVKNLSYRDFAILYRTNPQSRVIEEKLIESMLPYRIVGGSKFYEHAEIRDLIFYLRAAFSFHDELALRRIINTPRRGIAAAALGHLDEVSKSEKISFFEAVKAESQGTTLQPAARLKLTEFVNLLETYHRRFMAKSEPLATILDSYIKDIHYIEYIQSSSNSDENAQRRRENIDELVNALAAFERREGRDLFAFLQNVALEPPQKEEEENPDEITLMTLHSSKGLEFAYVFIVGCEENLLPHANSLNEPALSEERRLFYVGITRAKKHLTITYTQNRRKMYETIDITPSRFLSDIPESVIEKTDSSDSETAQKLRKEQEKIMEQRFAQMRALFN
ncbi:MAG: UvrD-helicase domain-containing protein [Proteobacteria bacterium]|nr:UvrD-helicase domain-containing protein [Pseudomonadota bacterium]